MASRVTPAGAGMYSVERDGRTVVVYVTGSAGDWWAFCDGEIYQSPPPAATRPRRRASAGVTVQTVTAPMPATVVTVVEPGASVRKGDTLVVLDAMKMEMPIRADADAVVTAVHCKAGDLVKADAVLIELR